MKTSLTLIALTLCAATCPAAPVTGWALIFDGDNDTSFTGASATTASPVVSDAHKSSIAANFPAVILEDGQSLTLTGTVSFSVTLVNSQFRWGLFDGDNPVTAGQGDEYAGFFSTSPSISQTNNSIWINDPDAGLVHPFDTGNAGGPNSASPITAMSAPTTTPVANTPLNFALTITRNGSALDVSASITDGNTYTSTGGATGVAPNINGFTFDSVAFLIGGSTSGSWNNVNATFSNIDVTLAPVSDPFAQWASTAITSVDPAADASFGGNPDNDAFSNGLEWILGGNPLGFDSMDDLLSPAGDATNGLTLTFTREDDSEGVADLFVEFSNDLFSTHLPPASSVPSASGTVAGVTYTITENGTAPDTIQANIPASHGPGGKLFARVGSTQD